MMQTPMRYIASLSRWPVSPARAVRLASAVAIGVILLSAGNIAMARQMPESFADLAEKLSPAVVNISTTQTVRQPMIGEMPQFPPGSPFEDLFRDFFERRGQQEDAPPRRVTSLGSGFIIDDDGIVVTNNHVIQDADEIVVTLTDGTQLEAELVGRDPKTDLAVLRVEPEDGLTAVSFGDSDKARVGDWVLAIGNPFGFSGSVSVGIISAMNRNINSGPYDSFIQTDAAINRGNSGGPLFDLDGNVIGVNTAIISPTGGSIGIGFAIPSAIAKTVIDQLIEFGETRRGWLGVQIQTVTDELADSLGLDEAKGALVARVTADGPADRAGIEQGDVIIEFDGQDVPQMRDLPRIVAETPDGKEVDVVVWRKGDKKTYEVTLGRLEEFEQVAGVAGGEAEESEVEGLGLTLSALTPMLRNQYDIGENIEGVAVVEVDAASPAAERGIRPGDVIVEVAQEPVSTPGEVLDKVREAKDANKKSVLLLLNRGGDVRFVALRLASS